MASAPTQSDPGKAPDYTSVRVLTRAEITANPNHTLPRASEGGYQRVLFQAMTASNADTSLVFMPVGQSSPPHTAYSEHIITVLEGQVAFRIDARAYSLGRLDQLFIPAGCQYEYWNAALREVVFLNLRTRADEWPPRTTAYGERTS